MAPRALCSDRRLAVLSLSSASLEEEQHVVRSGSSSRQLRPFMNHVGVSPASSTAAVSSIDPNRDFAFDQTETSCMQTVAARTLNELFRTHLYRILITFHGGTNVIGYEWGDTQHCRGNICRDAPDKKAMVVLAARMAKYAGPAGSYEDDYVVGDMGSTVYPVNGGMEDWAYGASWTNESVQCKPATLEGYAGEQTVYTDGSHRCVTYLVETAKEKEPAEVSLGTAEEPLVRGGSGDGHVPRNLRLLIAAVDALAPYVDITDVTMDATQVTCTWIIGGAFHVHETMVKQCHRRSTSRLFQNTNKRRQHTKRLASFFLLSFDRF